MDFARRALAMNLPVTPKFRKSIVFFIRQLAFKCFLALGSGFGWADMTTCAEIGGPDNITSEVAAISTKEEYVFSRYNTTKYAWHTIRPASNRNTRKRRFQCLHEPYKTFFSKKISSATTTRGNTGKTRFLLTFPTNMNAMRSSESALEVFC